MHPSEPESVIDAGVIAGLKELGGDEDPGLYLEVIELFLDDAAQQIVNLREAMARGDTRQLERIAHTLKSSSANVGALRFSKLCFEIEQLGRCSDLAHAGSLVERAAVQYDQVKAALEAEKR
ncbi:MAG: Hpt domain-containing protein [Planctomycetes bacterium]|nr:Hpt domain-containing protein [Planctomycetota bacterium]